MIIRVDPSSPVPPFEQIRAQVTTMIATGAIPRGTRLPTIRQLAKDLGLAEGTVARAYREMDAQGTLVARGRHGTFVASEQGSLPSKDVNRLLADAASNFAVQASQLGVEPTRALEFARKAFDGLE